MTQQVSAEKNGSPTKVQGLIDGLKFLWLELTYKCNLRCVHCYANAQPELPLKGKMSLEDWKTLLRDGRELGCRAIQFIGGEPTLSPHLSTLIPYTRELGYELVEVFTNGTVIGSIKASARLWRILIENQVSLAFSVYSLNPEIHAAVTQEEASLSKTISAIKTALRYRLPVRVGIVEMAVNSKTVEETKQFLVKLGVKSIGTDRIRGIGRGRRYYQLSDPLPFQELCGACWKGKLCVNPDGEIYPCVFSSFYPVGNVNNGLDAALNSDRLRSFRHRVKAETEAKSCYPTNCGPELPCGPECNPYMECGPTKG